MTIMYAGQAREALSAVIPGTGNVCVDIKGVTEIDLSGLQLLCAAHRTAVSANVTMRLDSDGNETFLASARAAGFLTHVGCPRDREKTCIWVGGY
jgi:hypothetical protein